MRHPVDTRRLRAFFTECSCQGVVALIDYLESPAAEGILEIGSGTIDFDNVLKPDMSDAEAFEAIMFKMKSLYIGSRDGSVTPLEWLAELDPDFLALPEEARRRFDLICGDFVAFSTAPVSGDVEIWDEHGHRTISAEEAMRERKEKLKRKIN